MVFGVLASHGRCNVRAIQERCNLPSQEIRAALLFLLRYQLILHSSADYEADEHATQYEANKDAAYNLTRRAAKVASIVGTRYGPEAEEFVKSMITWGVSPVGLLFDSSERGEDSSGKTASTVTDPHVANYSAQRLTSSPCSYAMEYFGRSHKLT